MKTKIIWIQRAGIFVGLILLLIQIYKGVLAFINEDITILRPLFGLYSIGILLFTIFIQVFAWRLLIIDAGYRIKYSEAGKGYVITFLPRYIPGSIWGYLSRGQWFLTNHNINYTVTNSVSVMEVAIAISAVVITTAIYFAFQIKPLAIWAIPLILIFSYVIWYSLQKVTQWPFVKNILGLYQKTDITFKVSYITWMKSLTLIAVNMVLNGFALYLLIKCFDAASIEFNLITLFELTALNNIGWLAGFLVFILPAGLGLRELTFSTLLIWKLGILPNTASAIAIVFRLVIVIAELMSVIIGLSIVNKNSSKATGNI